MKKNSFNICYSADNNYIEQLCVSIVSILKNSSDDESFNFFILNSGIDKQNRQKIDSLKLIKDFNLEFITVSPEEFKNCKLLSEKEMTNYHVTLPTYFRYKIGSIFKDISKILYIDCDIIVKKSLSPLFKIDLKDNFFAMVPDAESQKEAERLGLKKYFNAGVMLMNLDLWRQEDLETKLFDYSKNNQKTILWQDQDVINIVCGGRIKELKNDWNFQFFLYDFTTYSELVKKFKDVSILHLAGRFKPWIEPFEHPVFEEYYYYLSFTPWANKIQEYKYRCFGKYLEGNTGGAEKYVVSKEELFQKGLKPVYSMIDEAYDFTKKEISSQSENFDNKINKVYAEITNNYEFTKSEINKKAEEVRGEIFQKTNDIKENITQETDNKIGLVYSEITNNYEFTKSEINKKAEEIRGEISQKTNDIKEDITQETDGKIGQVYSEITNNYEFTKSEINKKAEEVILNNTNTINELSHRTNELMKVQKKQTEEKIDQIYSQIESDYELLKQQIKGNYEDINREIQENINRLEGISSSNFDETKEGFAKLIKQLSSNNDKFFGIINDYHEKQERRLLERLDEIKSEISENIVNPKYEELKNIIRDEISVIKETEMKTIKEYTENEINNSRQAVSLMSQEIERIKKENAIQDRNRQLDFEKQLLDMEMKYKSLKNTLTPVISFMAKFGNAKKMFKTPDERKQ